LALLAGFTAPSGVELTVSIDDGAEVTIGEFPVYSAGSLNRILDEGRPGIYGFASPARSYRHPTGGPSGETRFGADQIEALRALGYIEE
jgi:hypothetical protein